MKKYLRLLLYLWLYAGWFACVLLAKWDGALWSVLVPSVGGLLFWKALSPRPRDCVKLLVLCVAGMAVDTALMRAGIVHYASAEAAGLLPLWMISLWLLFAPAIYIFAGLFGRRLWLAALAGAVFGPLSYKSGETFGVLQLQGLNAVLLYAVFWALFLPLAITWVRRPSAP